MLARAQSRWLVRLVLAGTAWLSVDVTAAKEANKADLADVFGTTVPSDTHGKGDKELAHEWVGRFGRFDGRYSVLDGKTQFGYGVTDWFAMTPGLLTTWASISNVSGLDDHSDLSINGAAVEFKAKILDRSKSGLGIALLAEPNIAWLDGETGSRVRGRGVEFRAAFDWALRPERLFAGVNIAYGLDTATQAGVTERSSGVVVSSALSYRFRDAFFVGAEARYERAYEGLGLDRLQGEALFIGPTMFFKPSEKIGVTLSWSPQVWGREADAGRHLDLTSFERHQAKLKVAIPF